MKCVSQISLNVSLERIKILLHDNSYRSQTHFKIEIHGQSHYHLTDTLYAYALQPGSDSQDSHFFIGAVYFGFGVLRSVQRPVADDPFKNRHEELAVSSIVRNLAPVRWRNRNQ